MKLSARLRLAALLAAFALAQAAVGADNATITTETLLDEMIDMDRLGELPAPGYETVQFSSYDRRANLPNGRDWFANADGFGREPIPGVLKVIKKADKSKVGTYLLAEIDGPGALVRTWTASRNGPYIGMNGDIRMILDGAEKPIFAGPARDFLLNLYPALAQQHGLAPDGLSDGYHQRDAGYYPIGFAKGCRIEWTGRIDRVHFYHIEFRKYEAGSKVQTFEPKQLDTYRKTIKQVGAVLFDPSSGPAPAGKKIALEASLEPEKYHELLHLEEQSGKVTCLKLRIEADDLDRALRQTVLTVFFDHFSRPQVESPLGDFFGAAPGVNPYDTTPMKVEPNGTMTCRFVMPFKERAHFWVINQSPETVKLTGEVTVDDYTWDDALSTHFHALWRVNHEMQVQGRRGFDIPFILAQGQGRFVGCSVHLMNPCDLCTGNWWGEGDEKIFVDDEPFPTFFGTGSEDYFNYSWSVPDLFEYAYFAQPRCDGPRTRGFVTNNRWHILDDIPFKSRFDFFMEMIHHDVVDGLSYARISYFYGRPGIYTDQMPIFREDIRKPTAPDNWVPAARNRQEKAHFVQMEDMPGGESFVEEGTFWSCGKRVAWRPKKDGETLTLKFNVPKAGDYRLYLTMGLCPGSGRCEVQVNGKALSMGEDGVLDLFTPFHTLSRALNSSGKVKCLEGENTLTLISRGNNPDSKGTLIGADFLWVQP